MSGFNEDQLIVMALILDEEDNLKKKMKRRCTLWVHDLWNKRAQEGEFLNL